MSPRSRRWLDRLGFVALSGSVFGIELFRGVQPAGLALDRFGLALAVDVPLALVNVAGFVGFVGLSGLLFAAQVHRSRPDAGEPEPGGDPATGAGTDGGPGDDGTPDSDRVAAVVPVYEDADVLHVSVESLLAATHPVEVVVVCEPDDEPSLRRAEELAAVHDAVTVLRNGRPGSKAGAINHAVEATDAPHVGVFDADERVDPAFVAAAVDRLADGADVAQGRTVPRPTGLVEAMAYYESVLLNFAALRLLYALTGFRMAASRAMVCRRSALETVGGYDESMLTEDYRFAYDCYRAELRVVELLEYPSTIEAAHSVRDWWGQRKRWMRGYVQVFHQLLGEGWPPSGPRDALALAICGGTTVGGLLLVSLLSQLVAFAVVGSPTLALVPLGTVAGVAGALRYLDYRGGVLDGVGLSWLLAPVTFPAYGATATKALVEYPVHGASDWYTVSKGE